MSLYLARLRARQLLQKYPLAILCGTIHDSIVVDSPPEMCYTIRDILKQAIEDVPAYCKKVWDYNFSLPLKCEISYGPNKTNMKEFT